MIEKISDFKSRFNEALSIRNMKPVELSEKTGLSEATISQYRSGYAKPKYERIVRIADALNVSLMWLMGGDVPMEKNFTPPPFRHLDTYINVPDENGHVAFADKNGATITPNPSDWEKMRDLYDRYLHALPQIQDAVDSLLGSDKRDT